MKLIDWLKESAQGKDGRASSRSIVNYWVSIILLTALVVNHIVLTNYVIRNTNPNSVVVSILNVNVYLIIVLCAFVGVLFGIIAFQSITELVRTVRGGPIPPTPIEVKTQTLTTVSPKDNPDETVIVEETK